MGASEQITQTSLLGNIIVNVTPHSANYYTVII